MSYFMNPMELARRSSPSIFGQPMAYPGALQGGGGNPPPAAPPPVPMPAPAAAPIPPPAQAAQNLVARAPERGGYSAAVATALGHNQPQLHMGAPAMGAPPMQPAPYNHPAPLVIPPPPATGALGPQQTDPTQTPGMIAARNAGNPSGGLPNSLSFLLTGGLDPFGLTKKNSSPIQDIGRAMGQGKPITDSQWAQANYGPGGK